MARRGAVGPVTARGAGAGPHGLRCAAFGDRALLLEPGEVTGGPVGAWTGWVLAAAEAARVLWPGTSVVPGLRSVLVAFDAPDLRPPDADLAGTEVGSVLAAVPGRVPARGARGRLLRIDARYDGPDLADLAESLGVGAGELVSRHQSAEWTVAAIGFSPGFAYLTSPDPLFAAVPRRPEPRSRVPAGSVALAAGMCAVYPSATPGGWQLIGSTDQVLFDVHADPPSALAPGDRVEFRVQP